MGKDGKKKVRSPFIIFCNEMRPVVKEENPGIKPKAMQKELGKRWKELSPEDQQKYKQKAAQDGSDEEEKKE